MAHGTAAVKVGKLGDLLLAVWKNYLLLLGSQRYIVDFCRWGNLNDSN